MYIRGSIFLFCWIFMTNGVGGTWGAPLLLHPTWVHLWCYSFFKPKPKLWKWISKPVYSRERPFLTCCLKRADFEAGLWAWDRSTRRPWRRSGGEERTGRSRPSCCRPTWNKNRFWRPKKWKLKTKDAI